MGKQIPMMNPIFVDFLNLKTKNIWIINSLGSLMREAVGLSAINEYLKVKKKIMMKIILIH